MTAAGPPPCPICASAVAQPCLLDRPDYEYAVEARLDYWRCAQPDCGHVFASPLPDPGTLASFYRSYSTHAPAAATPWALRLLLWLADSQGIRTISGLNRGLRVLDFGCGGGQLLASLYDRGFRSLHGYDPDASALSVVRPGIATLWNDAQQVQAHAPFDLIVMNHVIEHLPDPSQVLHKLLAVLSPSGQLLVRTPNTQSNLARTTGDRWRGWETPRHLNLFSPSSLIRMCRSLDTAFELSSSNAMFLGIYQGSRFSAGTSRAGLRRYLSHAQALSAWAVCEFKRLYLPLSAEELCLRIHRS